MNHAFRHLHMPQELACEFLATFSRIEYALKAAGYALDAGGRVAANWVRFANEIDEKFCEIADDQFTSAVDYMLSYPPRTQVLRDGRMSFADQVIDKKQKRAQQTLLMVRTVRNNLFHGGKHYPEGEGERGRNERLVSHALTILQHCAALHRDVCIFYED